MFNILIKNKINHRLYLINHRFKIKYIITN